MATRGVTRRARVRNTFVARKSYAPEIISLLGGFGSRAEWGRGPH